MRMIRKKPNHQGSTLFTVIICITFLSILGTVMLSITLTNLRMKKVERNSRSNFYTCETALDEIKVGLQELTAETMKLYYEAKILPNITTYMNLSKVSRDTVNQKIREDIVNLLMHEMGEISLSEVSVNKTDVTSKQEVFTRYLSTLPEEGSEVRREVSIGKLDSTSESVLVKDVSINFVERGYRTSLRTNIRINLPLFDFTSEETSEQEVRMEQPYENYTLIADGEIISNNTVGTNTVTGNVYAGGKRDPINSEIIHGITVKTRNVGDEHHTLEIAGDYIVTRGNITVVDTAELLIEGNSEHPDKKPVIVADNLMTKTTNQYPINSSKRTTLKIKDGISLIKDDLVLDGRNSDVTVSGAYLGYTGINTAKGSAIMVNGSGSTLNLGGLEDLVLAGRAHISVEDTDEATDILTGESIGLKSNQKAYLVPGEFIDQINHNPVTNSDLPIVPEIRFRVVDGLDYTKYISSEKPYKIAAKQTVGGDFSTMLRYYYLNFSSGIQADKFLKEYMSSKPGILDQLAPMNLDEIKLPGERSRIVSAGNLMSYEDDTSAGKRTVQRRDGLSASLEYRDEVNDTSLNNAISETLLEGSIYEETDLKAEPAYKVGMLPSLVSRITHLLSFSNTSKLYLESDKVVDYTTVTNATGGITQEDIDNKKSNNLDEYVKYTGRIEWNNTDSVKQSFLLVDGDVTFQSHSVFNGVLIVTGEVTVEDWTNINGLVIALGEDGEDQHLTVGNHVTIHGRLVSGNDIILGNGCNISTNPDWEAYLGDIFTKEAGILSQIFKNVDLTVKIPLSRDISSFVDLSDMIIYENWRKYQ